MFKKTLLLIYLFIIPNRIYPQLDNPIVLRTSENPKICFTKNGDYLFSIGNDCILRKWEAKNGNLIEEFKLTQAEYNNSTATSTLLQLNKIITRISALAISPDDKKLAFATGSFNYESSGGFNLFLLDTETKKLDLLLSKSAGVYTSLAFSNNGRYLSWAKYREDAGINNSSPSLGWFDLTTMKNKGAVSGDIVFTSFSPDSKYAIFTDNYKADIYIYTAIDGKLYKQLRVDDEQNIEALKGQNYGWLKGDIPIYAVAINSDNSLIAAGGRTKFVNLWDLKTGKLIKQFKVAMEAIVSINFDERDKYLIVGCKPGILFIFDIQNNEKYLIANSPIQKNELNKIKISSILVSQNLEKAAFAAEEGYIYLLPEYDLILYQQYFDENDKIEFKSFLSTFKMKGEFETSREFNGRLADFQKRMKIFLRNKKNEIKERSIDLIKRSEKEVILAKGELGLYNADEEYFPIKIENISGKIYIPVATAPSFKDRFNSFIIKGTKSLNKNLEDIVYKSILINDTENNKTYNVVF